MKRRKLAAGALALVVSMTVCGCEQVYELTEAEEAAIVYYSTHAVTKFNKKQSEGIRDVAALEEKLAEEEESKQQETTVDDTKTDDAQPDANGGQADGTDAQEPQQQYVSLNQALKLGGVDAVYKGYDKAKAYTEENSFMVTANSGNELLVLFFDLKNQGNKTAKCNILSKMPTFRLTVNDKVSVTADTTILLNDLGTYNEHIQAGAKDEAVLIFQVQKGTVKRIKKMDLEVTVDDTVSMVQLVKK